MNAVYRIEPHIPVKLLFAGMPAPIEILASWPMLRYLDLHTERRIGPDGSVVYHLSGMLDRALDRAGGEHALQA